jgi:hypothetical protein
MAVLEMTTTLGFLLAVCVGVLSKIIYDWLANGRHDNKTTSNGNGNGHKTATLQKVADDVEFVKSTISKSDEDGSPLVYMPRELVRLVRDNYKLGVETNVLLGQILTEMKLNSELSRKVIEDIRVVSEKIK